ncbi:MAG: NosD domain-containing protein [Thermoproteota archaeon]|nr:right-handed parallel beta-helix repeat-containing protein [Candidatus Brockarchaeota archaeon]
MEKLVYTVFLMLALFTSQNAGNRLLASVGGANPHSFKNAAEKSFSIQMAINSADDGDTIYVPPGKYMENLKINKSVKLIANGTVELTPVNLGDNVVEILKDNVILTGFTVINRGGICGICVKGSVGYRIIGNRILGGDYGLLANGSSKGLIEGNSVKECLFGIYFRESSEDIVSRNNVESSKYGISLSMCFNSTIVENRMVNCTYGLYNHISDRSNILRNIFQNNTVGVVVARSGMNTISLNEAFYNFYGMHIDYSRVSLLYGNTVIGGLIGIRIQNSQNITLTNNTARFSTNNIAIESSVNITISRNTLEQARGHGVTIYETHNSMLSMNIISFCRVGISVENSRSTIIRNNSLEQNSYGLFLFRSSEAMLLANKCGNNTVADFYSEGAEDIIVEKLEINAYGNKEVSFTYQGDISIKGSRPIELETARLLSGFLNITLSSGGWIRLNVTYNLKGIQDIRKEEPVLYRWTGVEWKKVRGLMKEESSLKGSASFLLTETGIYVLGVGEKTVEQFPPVIGIFVTIILIIGSYMILRTLKGRRASSLSYSPTSSFFLTASLMTTIR